MSDREVITQERFFNVVASGMVLEPVNRGLPYGITYGGAFLPEAGVDRC